MKNLKRINKKILKLIKKENKQFKMKMIYIKMLKKNK